MTDPDFRRRLRATFQAEAIEHLRSLAADASALAATPDPAGQPPIVERLFRETHTLKGAARMVGETDAEAHCHALEQTLARLKHRREPVRAGEIEEIGGAVEQIATLLQLRHELPVAGAPAVATADPGPAEVQAGAPSANIRVAGDRLDALLMRAEEMVSAKLSGEQHAAALAELAARGSAWKREFERVRTAAATLRRHVDEASDGTLEDETTALLQYLDWTHEYLRELNGDVVRAAQQSAGDQRRLGTMVDQLLEETKELLMQPFSSLLESFPAFVADIARQQQKEIALAIEGATTEIDRRVLEQMRDALLHLVRNSVDHGIESATERRKAGKLPQGRLTIGVSNRPGGTVEIIVADDGRGIDARQVTATARRLGLIPEDVPELGHAEALSLLFQSGFSTRDEATELSGRGLGLAIVREKVERIGGNIAVESTVGQGTTFRIHVPLTLARFRGLFVAAQKQTFVIPGPYVQRVLRVPLAGLRAVKAHTVAEIDDRPIPVHALAEFVGLGSGPKAGAAQHAFLVVIESGNATIALRVDDVPFEQEVVMKSIGPLLRGARQYVGATLVGGGRVVPVLNVGHLLSAGRIGRRPAKPSATPARRRRAQRTVLVVEDSITSRSLLKNILQSAGYTVRTAVDGADAMTVLKFEPVDLVITDVQMPRLDGFELTARIRSDKALSTLPVILITSLASREDRERGVDAGANAYIVKSSFDQSDLIEAIGRLLP